MQLEFNQNWDNLEIWRKIKTVQNTVCLGSEDTVEGAGDLKRHTVNFLQ